jgi:hypothetical protein
MNNPPTKEATMEAVLDLINTGCTLITGITLVSAQVALLVYFVYLLFR